MPTNAHDDSQMTWTIAGVNSQVLSYAGLSLPVKPPHSVEADLQKRAETSRPIV